MDSPQLTDLCNRLAARLGDRTLTRFHLIDMAMALMFVKRDLDHRLDVHDGMASDALTTALQWIRDHSQDASVDELRSHFAAAIDATAHMLVHDAGQTHPENRQRSGQERARA